MLFFTTTRCCITIKMKKVSYICMCFLIVIIYASHGQTPDPAECQSWSNVISSIALNIGSIPGASNDCSIINDCTGVICNFNILGKAFRISLKLLECNEPPQMRLLVTGSDFSHEVTITHGRAYPIPGLNVSPFPSISLSVEIIVRFEDYMNRNILVGIDYHTIGIPVTYPLFDDTIIHTSNDCTGRDPKMVDCEAFNELVTNVDPSATCTVSATCNRVDCSQGLRYGILHIPVEVGLRVDSCSIPVRMILTAKSALIGLDWTQQFTESDVSVIDHLQFNIKVTVNVTMRPSEDLMSIVSTIIYEIYSPTEGPQIENFLNNGYVPIIRCEIIPVPPLVTIPSGSSDECSAWQGIKDKLKFSVEGYSLNCMTLPQCNGLNCTAVYQSIPYQLSLEEFHCQDPTYLLVTLNGQDQQFSFSHNFTTEAVVDVFGVGNSSIDAHIQKESMTTINVGIYFLIASSEDIGFKFPVVPVQTIQVTPCEDIVTNPTTLMITEHYSEETNSQPGETLTALPTIHVSHETVLQLALMIMSSVVVVLFVIIAFLCAANYLRRQKLKRNLDILLRNTDDLDAFTSFT